MNKHHVHENRTKQIDDNSYFGFGILLTIFVAAYIMAPLLAVKLISIGGIIVPAGILAYSLTFPCTDITAEMYGERYARRMVIFGLIAICVSNFLIQISVYWPAADFWEQQASYQAIFGGSLRFFVAGLLAYIVSQLTDVWIFAKVRQKMDGKWLWFRNNVSTAISKFLDMTIFVLIAFYGVYDMGQLWTIIFGGWLIHLVIAAADTPLVYLGVWWLKKAYPKLKE